MKNNFFLRAGTLWLFLVVLAVIIVCIHAPLQNQVAVTKSHDTNSLDAVVTTNLPDDSRLEVKNLYQFATLAKLYNFNPKITVDKPMPPPFHNGINIETPTHDIEINTKLHQISDVFSRYEDSLAPFRDTDLNPAELRKSWADCKGVWNKKEMINETLNILKQLGYTELLDAVQNGNSGFKETEYIWLASDGQQNTNYPFATVTLSDANGPRIIAEYRMGTNGQPAGLTHWTAR